MWSDVLGNQHIFFDWWIAHTNLFFFPFFIYFILLFIYFIYLFFTSSNLSQKLILESHRNSLQKQKGKQHQMKGEGRVCICYKQGGGSLKPHLSLSQPFPIFQTLYFIKKWPRLHPKTNGGHVFFFFFFFFKNFDDPNYWGKKCEKFPFPFFKPKCLWSSQPTFIF